MCLGRVPELMMDGISIAASGAASGAETVLLLLI